MDQDFLLELGLDRSVWDRFSAEFHAWLRSASTDYDKVLPSHLSAEFSMLPDRVRHDFVPLQEAGHAGLVDPLSADQATVDLNFRRIIGVAFGTDDSGDDIAERFGPM